MSSFSRGVSGARTILLAVRIDRLSSYPEATSGKFEALARISCQADRVRFNLRHPDIERLATDAPISFYIGRSGTYRYTRLQILRSTTDPSCSVHLVLYPALLATSMDFDNPTRHIYITSS